jgi:hypothetical protein
VHRVLARAGEASVKEPLKSDLYNTAGFRVASAADADLSSCRAARAARGIKE